PPDEGSGILRRSIGLSGRGRIDGRQVWGILSAGQRVLNAQGKISPRNGGHGGLQQQQLLEAEGVRFDANHRVRWSEFGWEGGRGDEGRGAP
ncbi:MAG: hypothetical protein ACO4AU_04945, partial [bacterium]